MKKGFSKMSLKKKIFTIAAGVATFCALAVIGTGLLTKADDTVISADKAASESVPVGNKVFTKENPLVVLEILPHKAYDELGIITGNDEGSVKWKTIVDGAPKVTKNADGTWNSTEAEAFRTYVTNYVEAYRDVANYPMAGTGLQLCCKVDADNDDIADDGKVWVNLDSVWTNVGSEWGGFGLVIGYDLNNIKWVLGTENKDENGNMLSWSADGMCKELVVETEDGIKVNNIRNYFAYSIFGDLNMENKIKIVSKVAGEVTKEDIDNAGLVYISKACHNFAYASLYQLLNPSDPYQGSYSWTLGDSKLDLKADVAMHLEMQSFIERKALIFNSVDLSATNNIYSNIARLTTIQTSIDADVFIMDFAFSEYGTDDRKTGYYGNVGEFLVGTDKDAKGKSVSALTVTLDVDKHYEYMGWTKSDSNVGVKEIPFDPGMFVYNVIKDGNNAYGYMPNSTNGSVTAGDLANTYPAYNSIQEFLTKSTYVFNSNNSMTNGYSSDNNYKSDYDSEGNYLGSSYGDALFQLDLVGEDIKSFSIIKYILGAYGGDLNPPDRDGDGYSEIKVLEIEPAGKYQYSNSSIDDKKIIARWFGYPNAEIKKEGDVLTEEQKKDKSVTRLDIQIDNISMNGFNGLNVDIRAEYDLIIVGAYDAGELKSASIYNAETTLETDDKIYNNDITYKAYNKLLDYIKADMPVVLDRAIYYGQESAAAADSYVHMLNIMDINREVLNDSNVDLGDKEVASGVNVTWVDINAADNEQNTQRTIKYISRPTVTIAPVGAKNYNQDDVDLVSVNDLENMVFSGVVTNTQEFRVKIYIDRNCDSIFSEDYDGDEPELILIATDQYGRAINNAGNPIVQYGGKAIGAICTVNPTNSDIANIDVDDTDVASFGYKVRNELKSEYDDTLGKDVYSIIKDEDGNITWDVNINLPLSRALNGYLAWKVEVEDTLTGRVNISTGAFALENEAKTIKVIQIHNDIPDDATGKDAVPTNIDLMPGSKFRECYDATTAITNFGLEVKKYTKSEFNALADKTAVLNEYSMLVLGLNDNYGVSNGELTIGGELVYADLDADSLNAINAYIDNGNSVLFTHDSLSYKMNKSDAANGYENLNDFTKMFQTKIGVQQGYRLSESLNMKLNKNSLFDSINPDSTTRGTDKVTRLNQGEITEYPYKISGTTTEKTIQVAETHGQYFKLNLEDLRELIMDSEGELVEKDADDVVVWYTLDQTSTVNAADPGKTTNDVLSKFFTATGQDAVNNYYIYSVGNITYTSAGHSEITANNEEMQLFVNTFVRAILSGNKAPVVSYENAAKESENVYSTFYRGTYSDNYDVTSGSYVLPSDFRTSMPVEFSYRITDADMAMNISTSRISEAIMFYDRNCNDVYDAEDVRICYIECDDSGNISYAKNNTTAKSVINGKVNTCENLWAVTSGNIDAELEKEMAKLLLENRLRIGIQAVDGHDAKGYAILKFVQRDLHKLQ